MERGKERTIGNNLDARRWVGNGQGLLDADGADIGGYR